jgi:pimeloyl-ACP methyl ester carboxylesterase
MNCPEEAISREDTVVLAHGLAALPVIMAPLARSLQPNFGNVINWGYPSLWSRIETHADRFVDLLRQLDSQSGGGRIHLVCHSMGCIIGRLALAEFMPQRLGRFVMIAPPNRGSRWARHLAPHLGRLSPPIAQLTDEQSSFVCSLPAPTAREIGIIAAKFDFMVAEPNTSLGCEADHIVLPGLHSTVLWRRETAMQVQYFIEHGHFQRPASASSCR